MELQNSEVPPTRPSLYVVRTIIILLLAAGNTVVLVFSWLSAGIHHHPHTDHYIYAPWAILGCSLAGGLGYFLWNKLRREGQIVRSVRGKYFEVFRAAEIAALGRLDKGERLKAQPWRGWGTSLYLSFYHSSPTCPTNPRRSWFGLVILAMAGVVVLLAGSVASFAAISFWMATIAVKNLNLLMQAEVELFTARGHLSGDGDELAAALLVYLALATVQMINYFGHRGWLQTVWSWGCGILFLLWLIFALLLEAGKSLCALAYDHLNPTLYFSHVQRDIGIDDREERSKK